MRDWFGFIKNLTSSDKNVVCLGGKSHKYDNLSFEGLKGARINHSDGQNTLLLKLSSRPALV